MKIIWAHSHFGSGGGPKTILSWALGLKELGHDINFIGHGGRLLDGILKNKFSFIPIGKNRFRPSLIYAYKVYKFGKKMNPDVLIGVGNQAGMEASLAAYLLKKPILLIFNVSPRDSFWDGDPKWTFPQISDMVVVNQEFKQLCVEKYGWDPRKIHYIPERVIPKAQNVFNINKSMTLKRICVVRRLDKIKAEPVLKLIDNIREFLQIHNEISMDIIGDGSHLNSVISEASEINNYLSRRAINCLGYIDDIENKLDDYDLVIATEKAAIEAIMARKTTAILRNDGSFIPVTQETINGLFKDNFIGNHVSSKFMISDYQTLITFYEEMDKRKIQQLGVYIDKKFDYRIGAAKISNLINGVIKPNYFFQRYLPRLIERYFLIIRNKLSQQ